MGNGKQETSTSGSAPSQEFSHSTATSLTKSLTTVPGTGLSSGGSSSSPHQKPLTDSTDGHNQVINNPVVSSKSNSTVSTPSSSQLMPLDASEIINQSRKYLHNLIESLESCELDVEMFVILLQNISNGDEELLCNEYETGSTNLAVDEMIEETVQRLIKKRDDICIDNDASKNEWLKLDLIVSELVLRQETL